MRRRLRRTGWVGLGALLGFLTVAILFFLYVRMGRVAEVRTAIGERLQIPPEALDLERLTLTGRARISLRNVVIFGEAGDTIVAAPRVSLWFDARSMDGDGPLEFTGVEVHDPYARLIQSPDGSWNIFRAFGVTVEGQPVGEVEEGRGLRFTDVRVIGGRGILAIPAETPAAGTFVSRMQIPFTTMGGVTYQSYSFSGMQARLPLVWLGGLQGWRVEVASLTGDIIEPRLRIAQMEGWVEEAGEDAIRFSVSTLRVGESRLAGAGVVRFAEAGPLYDVRMVAAPLRLADLQPLFPTTTLEGSASFAMELDTRADGRTELALSGLDFAAFGSRASGDVRVAFGGDRPLAFGPTRLSLDPLELETLERLALVEQLPVLGTVRGTVSTAEFSPESQAGRLEVNLAGTLVPRDDPGAPPSTVVAVGPLRFGGEDEPVIFDGLRIQLQPLRLATLAAFLPEQRDLLRGEARGFVELGGSSRNLRLTGGDVAYQVGAAPPTRLTNLGGMIALDPLTYDIRAQAQPLQLATLSELFPALPFETATLSGPFRIQGGADDARFEANLTGPTGGLRFAGSATFGEPTRFDVSGELAAFTASRLVSTDFPLEGPVSGTFAVRGTTMDMRFEVDLSQALGRFALGGRLQRTEDPPIFQLAGRVTDFRVGALLGQPALFPAPLTGDIAVTGGGREPYRYDVDLRGNGSVFDVEGIYLPGPVPRYTARGQVRGLAVHRLPFVSGVPATFLNASIDLDGRGTTLETLAGRLWLDATGSNVGGVPVDRARANLLVADGVLQVDTLVVALRNNRLTAAGTWGLTQPVAAPLRFSINAPDLGTLSRVLPTEQLVPAQMSGSLTAEGWVAGSVRWPQLAVSARGRRLRYEDFRAGTLALEVEGSRQPGIGWSGRFSGSGDDVVAFANEELQTVRFEFAGNEGAVSAGLYARQDGDRELSVSGMLEMEGLVPRAVALETLELRLADASWTLVERTRVQWGGVAGLEIQNLALQRTGEVGGFIRVDGRLPPTGAADLRIDARDVDLADARRIWRRAPDVQGRLTVNAVLEGPATAPEMSVRARVEGLVYEGTAADTIVLDADYANRRLDGRADLWIGGRQLATAEGSIPVLLSYENYVPSFETLPQEPLVAEIRADSLPLDLVAAIVPGLSRGSGVARADVRVRGTLDNPTFTGFARLDDGGMRVEQLGVHFTDIRAALALEQNRIRIDTLSARSGGTVSVAGFVTFDPGESPRLSLTADLSGFRAVDNQEIGRVTTSGRVALSGPAAQPVLTGRLELEDSQINVPSMDETGDLHMADLHLGQMGEDPLPVVETGPAFITDLRIDGLEVGVGDGVWIVSDEARVQIAGEIIVYRAAADLRVFGNLQAVRGRYTLAIGTITREFDVVSGRVQFLGTPEVNPIIDIVAAHRVRTSTVGTGGDLVILVHLTGNMRTPQLALTSDTPVPLSESELLSFLVFGRPEFELGGVGGALAEQFLVQEVLGGYLATELERPLLAAGLCDYVRVRPGLATFGGLLRNDPLSTLGGAAIECGRQLPWVDGLFLTLETGIGALFGGGTGALEWGVGLEWQINDEWQWELHYGPVRRFLDFGLVANQGTQYQFSTDIRRRWEYGGRRRPTLLELLPRDPMPGEIAPVIQREEEGQ